MTSFERSDRDEPSMTCHLSVCAVKKVARIGHALRLKGDLPARKPVILWMTIKVGKKAGSELFDGAHA